MIAKTIKAHSTGEMKMKLGEFISKSYRPSLAIVFLSIKYNIEEVCEILETYDLSIYGSTTNGEFIDGDIGQGSIAVMLLDLEPEYFFIQFAELNGKDDRKITSMLGNEALKRFDRPAFLVSGSNLHTDGEQMMMGFADSVGPQVNVFGGMAGDDFTLTDQFVFTNGKSSSRGIVAVVLDEDKIIVKGKATHGWKAIGTEKTVTRSEGNRVYTIDGVPALDLTAKYSGIPDITRENKALTLEIAVTLPLQLQREKGDPIMRPGLVNWEDHSFTCGGTVPQGSKVRFSLPPDFDVIETVIQGCRDLKTNEIQYADALIVYSCNGRLVSLGPLMKKEIEGVQAVWDAPMIGFFSNAELARATNGNLELHNITTCCVVLKQI